MALISLSLRPPTEAEKFNESGEEKTGIRTYIAKYDADVADINDYEAIGALPALYSVWSGTHNDTFLHARKASYHDNGTRKMLIIVCDYSNTDTNGQPFGTLLDETFDRDGGEQVGSRAYRIDSSFADAAAAQEAAAVPQVNSAWSINKLGVIVKTHNSSRNGDGTYLVVANYETTVEQKDENPLDEPVLYSYSSNKRQIDIEVDQKTGARIVHTNNKPVFPLRKGRDDMGVITIVRNEADFSSKDASKFRGKTNSRTMNILDESFGEDEAYMESITAAPMRDAEDSPYFRVTYVVWHHEDDFRDKIVNADFEDINGTKAVTKSGFSDTATALDADGEFIEGNVSPADQIINRPNVMKQADLESLGF